MRQIIIEFDIFNHNLLELCKYQFFDGNFCLALPVNLRKWLQYMDIGPNKIKPPGGCKKMCILKCLLHSYTEECMTMI